MKRLTLKQRRGQGMTEYILIVALIAIGAIAVVTTFGNNVRGVFNMSSQALAGSTQVQNTNQVSDQSVVRQQNGLKTFAPGQGQ